MELLRRKDLLVKWLLTLGVALFAYWRQPEMLLEPRFWAEEGTSYFAFAYNSSWWENLFSPQYGYYTLYNSIATSLALLVDLQFAPYVTTYLAFFVQVAVSAAVIWWNIPLLDSWRKKIIVALAIQYLAYSRIWVTTIGVQYWLCVLSLLILLQADNTSKKKSVLDLVMLLHNGLTGVLTCFMVPAFAYKAFATKSKKYIRQTVLLTACSVLQVAIFLAAMNPTNSQMSRRLVYCDPVYMLSKLVKFEFSVPFFGQLLFQFPIVNQLEDVVRQFLYPMFGEAVANYKFSLLETSMGLGIVLLLALLFYYRRESIDAKVILIALIFVTVFSTIFSVNMSSGPRYTFSPSVMIMLFVVSCLQDRLLPWLVRGTLAGLVFLSIGASLIDYRLVMMGMAYDPRWPKWRDELAIWRQHPDYQIQIWPPGWTMKLKQQ